MRICYLSLTEKVLPRDEVYLSGLKDIGVEIVECRDTSPGLKKFWRLWQKHARLKNDYDLLLVGYSSHILVPLARLISRKRIIFNALCSMYEGTILSRQQAKPTSVKAFYTWFLDFLTFHCANVSLIESQEQKRWLMKKFYLAEDKLLHAWTGADDKIFFYDPTIKKLPVFTVLFRGKFLPESGVEYAIEAAMILRNENINFRIIGSGIIESRVINLLKGYEGKNIEWLKDELEWDELRQKSQECHLSLGQLSDHNRLERTIPHKAFESITMKLPYLTARNKGILELLKEDETCLCCNPADPTDLANKIMWLKSNFSTAQKIAENAYNLFQEKLTPKNLAKAVLDYEASIR